MSSENRSISPTHSDDSRSVTPPATQQKVVTPVEREAPSVVGKPKAPQRKRRPAPKPPCIAEEKQQRQSSQSNQQKQLNLQNQLQEQNHLNQKNQLNQEILLNQLNQQNQLSQQSEITRQNPIEEIVSRNKSLDKPPSYVSIEEPPSYVSVDKSSSNILINKSPSNISVDKPLSNISVEKPASNISSNSESSCDTSSSPRKLDNGLTICHSRTSSDSSGYHEASVLSDNNASLPRNPKAATETADVSNRISGEHSKSAGNLAKMVMHSKSTSSLAIPGEYDSLCFVILPKFLTFPSKKKK